MEDIILMGQKHMEGKQITVKVGTQKFVLQNQMQHLITGIRFGKKLDRQYGAGKPNGKYCLGGRLFAFAPLDQSGRNRPNKQKGLRVYYSKDPILYKYKVFFCRGINKC